jgi:hypothetical protein
MNASTAMNFQLVIQFRSTDRHSLERLHALEDKLAQSLGKGGEVDGHDFGMGECNVFVLTNDPRSAFEHVREHLLREEDADWKAAFRHVNEESFTVLWPSAETPFEIA